MDDDAVKAYFAADSFLWPDSSDELSQRYVRCLHWLLGGAGFSPAASSTGLAVDVGSGGGRYTQVLTEYFSEVVVIDGEERYCAAGNERFGPRIRFDCGDARALPIASESASLVMSIGLAEYLGSAQLAGFLAETMRVLVPGGIAVSRFWSACGAGSVMAHLGRGVASEYPVLHFHSRRQIERACNLAGLREVRTLGGLSVARRYGDGRWSIWADTLRGFAIASEIRLRRYQWLAPVFDTAFFVATK